jgi:hypothetical protein
VPLRGQEVHTLSRLQLLQDAVIITGVFTRRWFEKRSPSAADQWGHFSVIGGMFQVLGEGVSDEPGVYRRAAMQVWIGF